MANISSYMQKAYLDWCLGGAAATQPKHFEDGHRGRGLGQRSRWHAHRLFASVGVVRCGELASGLGIERRGHDVRPVLSVGSAIGVHVWDGSPVGSSNMLWYGTLAVARTSGIGDSLVFNPGALTITLA